VDRKHLGTSTIGPHPARSVPAVAPRDPPRSAVACRSAIGRPILAVDNNICERALKKAILHRKNSLFFRSQRLAKVGDLYLSLIHTCELNGGNPFEYLTALQRHAAAVAAAPGD
jgi:hypothetical protein